MINTYKYLINSSKLDFRNVIILLDLLGISEDDSHDIDVSVFGIWSGRQESCGHFS